jgi:4-hydroxy-4-methyl-2-oxoglutarate aldolase
VSAIDPDVLKALAAAPTTMISDALGRWGNMDPTIRPVALGMQCCGAAFTLRCWPADNLTIHRAVELAEHGVIFAQGATARGPVKETLGPIQVPIQCGGVLVRPGDVVAGDDDGVVVVPREEATAVVERVRAIHHKEEQVKKALAAGQTTPDILGLRSKFPQ